MPGRFKSSQGLLLNLTLLDEVVVQSSPMALLAWLGEKFNSWSDEPPSLDQLLETVTIWWLRESFPTSIWAYSEILTGELRTPSSETKNLGTCIC